MRRDEAVYTLLKTFPMEASAGDSVLEQTPGRVAKMWDELLSGYNDDPQAILNKKFDVMGGSSDGDGNGIVCISGIRFYSCCEHHLVPFYGTANIAYLPGEFVTGLSKFARLVECYARRLQVQERLTQQLITAIEQYLKPRGAMVVVEAEHMCMSMRGVQKPGTKTVTSRVSGAFVSDKELREEARRLLGL